MTKNELIDAYVRGDVDRRGFIRKLTAMGVSAAAATAYAGSFARDAAASTTRNGAGFVARAQDADEEYGVAVAIENIQRAITKFTERSEELVDKLEEIANRGNGNGPKFEHVQTVKNQIVEQREAMLARFEAKHGVSDASSSVKTFRGAGSLFPQGASVEQMLLDVANELNVQSGIAVALIPNIADLEDLSLMASIGFATARQAALFSSLAGLEAVPGAFEMAIDPATVE